MSSKSETERRLPGVRRALVSTAIGLLLALAGTTLAAPDPVGRKALAEDPRPRVWTAPAIDVPKLLAEDEANLHNKEIPFRVGYPMKTRITPTTDGVWSDKPGGGQLWQMEIRSKSALWIVVGFTVFGLQEGAELYVSDASKSRVLGPYGADDIRSHGQLWFPPIEGDAVTVELHWPEELRGVEPKLLLGTVSHGYKVWGGFGKQESDATKEGTEAQGSGSCNFDVECPQGAGWDNEVRSVVRMLSGGFAFCTGALINNTSGDCTPYVLTAAHCSPTPASTTYQFNYQRSSCGSGAVETGHVMTGSTLIASYSASDVMLLELDEQPPAEFDVYYSGWSRSPDPATRSTGIHHPQGDVKKISHNLDTLVDGPGGGSGWGDDHWRITEWEEGTTEPSSSGSPLFDQNRRIVGQLHGGLASCSNLAYDEYGKFDVSWNGGGQSTSRLRDWLDPLSLGVETLDGVDRTVCETPRPTLMLDSYSLDDSAKGNGDGVLDPGEEFEILPTLTNLGSQTATGVVGRLTTTTPGVTIEPDQILWPDIATGQSLLPDASFLVTVSPDFTCGDTIDLRLEASANEEPGSWSSEIVIGTGSPVGLSVPFEDDIESGTGTWNIVRLSNNNPFFISTTRANSPIASWKVTDIASLSDTALVMEPVSSVAPQSKLTFMHYMNSEAAFDGGVLEYSQNGSAWTDAGELITQGGYNVPISTDWSSTIGGRLAWSGDFGEWRQVTVDLSPLVGSDVLFRWRFATDSFVGAEGWYIDDVRIESPQFECNTVDLAEPGEASAPGQVPFRISRNPDTGYTLSWSAPTDGGPVEDYVLYALPLDSAAKGGPLCLGSLGGRTTAFLADFPSGNGLVIVARNAGGEGSYGIASDGTPRDRATNVCP